MDAARIYGTVPENLHVPHMRAEWARRGAGPPENGRERSLPLGDETGRLGGP